MDPPLQSSPIRRPVLTNNHSSPLNPNSNESPHAIAISRRFSGTNSGMPRSPPSYTSFHKPTRFLARTPLSFLSSSPSKSHASRMSSTGSSTTWQLGTPPAVAKLETHLLPPSPISSSPIDMLPMPNVGSAPHPPARQTVKIPLAAVSDTNNLMGTGPSPLRHKMVYLQSLPPSPPIVVPSAQLLELSPCGRSDTNEQHSIASPFVNLVSAASPACVANASSVSSPFVARQRHGQQQRSSSLSQIFDTLHVADPMVDDRKPETPTINNTDLPKSNGLSPGPIHSDCASS